VSENVPAVLMLGRMVSDKLKKRNRSSANRCIIAEFTWMIWGKPRRATDWIAVVPPDIQAASTPAQALALRNPNSDLQLKYWIKNVNKYNWI
jgi:hypothetical protein